MKIGFDAKRALHNDRGLGNFSRTLLAGFENLSKQHQFHLYSPKVKKEEFLHWMEKHQNFSYHFPSNVLLQNFPAIWRSLLLTKDLVRDELDLYHGLSHELPPGIEKTDIKSIVTIHDLIYLRFPQYFSAIDRKVFNIKFRKSCQRADQIIAICQQTKDDLINFFNIEPDRIAVHYQACHPQFYQLCSNVEKENHRKKYGLEKPYLLFVGALEERKNSLALLNAFDSISEKIDHDLIIIGRGGKYKEKLYEICQKPNLKNRVRILEDVPYQDNPLFCQNADLMVYPSFFEGFGLPIVEAMYSGTPVITSEGGVFPEAGGEAASYINPKDPKTIAQAIVMILSSRDLQLEMSGKGLEQVKDFHIDITSKKMMELYKSL